MPLSRQHIGLAGEMGLGRPVAHIDLVIGRLKELLVDSRRQALPQHDRIALAMLEALDTELLVLVGYGRLRRSRDRDIRREVGLARERVGKVETDPRVRQFVVDFVVDDAKAMLGAHRLVDFPHIEVIAPVKRGLQRVEGGAPHFMTRETNAEQSERPGLRLRRRRMLEGGVSSRRALRDKFVAAVPLRVVRLDRDIGECEPVRRVFRRRRDSGRRQLRRIVKFRGGGRGRSGLPQVVWRPSFRLGADRRGLSAQRLGQADRVARHVLARERLDLRRGRRASREKRQANGE